MKTILLSLILGLNLPAMAGSAAAIIKGKTESGRTSLEVHVGDIDGDIGFVSLTIDGKSYKIRGDESTFQSVIRDRKHGIYVLVIQTEERTFRLYMIPNSEKIIDQGDGYYRSRFAAVIEATDPREDDGKWTPKITIGCTLDWSI
jgi:hypothetical protein